MPGAFNTWVSGIYIARVFVIVALFRQHNLKVITMAGSLNKVQLIGNLGKGPEVREMDSGDKVCNFSLATSESWKDKKTGERKEKTEWHRVVLFAQGLVGVAEQYLKKGSKVYIEGQLETRKWSDEDGTDRYSTEVVLRDFDSKLVMLDAAGDSTAQASDEPQDQAA